MPDELRPAAAPYRLNDRIGHRVSKAAALMHRFFDAGAEGLGISRMAWTALASVGFEGLRSPSALAAHLGVSRPAASRLLRQLERQGLVAREQAANDGRAVSLRLTAAGERRAAQVRAVADATDRRFKARLTAEELEELFRLLDKLSRGETGGVERF